MLSYALRLGKAHEKLLRKIFRKVRPTHYLTYDAGHVD